MKKIESKIVGYDVSVEEESKVEVSESPVKSVSLVPEKRPTELSGVTYKIKPSAPYADHALYITISDVVGSDGIKRPMEIFINSKDMASYEWVVALTRIISFIFRLGLSKNDNVLLVNELKSVFSPGGGFYPGKGSGLQQGRIVPSLVAAIGQVLERHLEQLGVVDDGLLDDFGVNTILTSDESETNEHRSVGAAAVRLAQCPSCSEQTLQMTGGCEQCLQCNYSRC